MTTYHPDEGRELGSQLGFRHCERGISFRLCEARELREKGSGGICPRVVRDEMGYCPQAGDES